MPVKIRLARHGRKKFPFYHIVVADSRAPRDGRLIEKIGVYDPKTNPATIEIDFDKSLNWLQKGAQPTDTCRAILSYKGVLYKKHLLEGVKKNAFSAEEAETRFKEWLEIKESKIRSKADNVEKLKDDKAKDRLEKESKIRENREKELLKKRQVEEAVKDKEEDTIDSSEESTDVEENVSDKIVEKDDEKLSGSAAEDTETEKVEAIPEVIEDPEAEAKEESKENVAEDPEAEAKEESKENVAGEPEVEAKEESKENVAGEPEAEAKEESKENVAEEPEAEEKEEIPEKPAPAKDEDGENEKTQASDKEEGSAS